jgi:hypothetical protein
MFNAIIFNNGIFNMRESGTPPTPPPVVDVKTGTGGIEGDGRRRRIVKPTGLLDRPKRKVDERVDDSREIEAEIAARLAREFVDDTQELVEVEEPPIAQMTVAEIDYEIGVLLRKKLKQEEEEIMAMILLASME